METPSLPYLHVCWPLAWRRTLRLLFERDPSGRDFWVVDGLQPLSHPSEALQYVDVVVSQYLRECPDEQQRLGATHLRHAVREAVLTAASFSPTS